MPIIFFGSPQFAIPSLKALIEAGEKIAYVVTQPDKIGGRGHKLLPTPVKVLASEMNIPVLEPTTLKDDALINRLYEIRPEFIIVVAYGKMLPRNILDIPLSGCINLHASLLPKYRGAAPIQWAIIRGEVETGVTTMLMDEGLDTGPIFLKKKLRIEDEDNAESLSQKLSKIGASLLIETINGIREGILKPVPQEGEPSYAPPLKKENGNIDWEKSAKEIFNLIRGSFPWPGAHCFVGGERVRILKARPLNDSRGKPGIIEKISKDELIIGTGKGLLSILEIQPSGRSAMNIKAFLQGRRLIEGTRL